MEGATDRRRCTRAEIFATLLIAAIGLASCDGPARPKPPNLILISIDTLRADHVGAYGYSRPTTPAIDRFAAESVLFKTCVAHAPTTLASHGSILTSLLPHQHGASISRRSRLAEGVTTLAQVLQKSGYRTASINGGIQLDAAYGLDRGFDHHESAQSREAKPETLSGPENRMRAGVDRALSWLGQSDRPFFLFLHSYEIHHPYNPDEGTLRLFDVDYRGSLGNEIKVDFLRAVNQGKKSLAKGDLEHIINTYDAELRSADEALGSFFAELRKRGIYDDSMIVITSDHGEEFGEHGAVGWHAQSLFDELLLVPLIVKYTGSRHAGTVVSAQVRGIDVAPTSLAGLGIDIPSDFSGENLGPEIAGSTKRVLPAISMFDRIGHPVWALRTSEWKVLSARQSRLFDLSEDPGESVDLRKRHPQFMEELRTVGRKLMKERPKAPVTPVSNQDETTDQLRALGYIE